MKKQKKQMAILLLLLAAAMGAYFGIIKYNQWSAEQEKEKKEEAQIYVTNFSTAEVEKFSYDYQGETFSFTRLAEEWFYDGDETLDIEEDGLEDMIADAVNLAASEKIENVTDLSQYGLDSPLLTVTFQISGKEYTLHVGDYNDMLGLYYAYIAEDETNVYLISSSFKSGYNTTLEELIVVVEETETGTEETKSEEEIETENETTE